MASPSTRSSKRAEGLTTRSSARNNVAIKPITQSNIGRKKRPRDSTEHADLDRKPKKQRIAIEINSRAKALPKHRSLVVTSQNATSEPPLLRTVHKHQQQPEIENIKITTPQPIKSQPTTKSKPTIHHEKVANGIKHELNRLQPNFKDLEAADKTDDKRKLRSQEGTRFKSELSAYFPEYDEVIGNEPKEDHILNLDTPIIITDSSKTTKQPTPRKANTHEYPLKEFPDSLFTALHNAQRVDFSFIDRNWKDDGGKDPLSDEYFETIHRKPERQEKAIRNTDKGRAQHEKDQVIRLLEGLQGHDWLKLMGVSGVTDGRKKEFEPAREHFIRGCQAILEKFRTWREEEKRRKQEKEAALAEEEEEEANEGDEEASEDVDDEDNESDGDPPDYSDVDASAARQLHEEIARAAALEKHPGRKPKVEPLPATYETSKEFKSFFSKPHIREAAMGKTRRSGRGRSAWGYPVPEVPEREFDLPEEYRDEETLRAHARRKRRDKRVSKS